MIAYEKLFLVFLLYSIFGWLIEVIATYPDERKLVNRGFLIGPYCPIYGFGFLIITIFLKNFIDHPIILFFAIMCSCTIIEYITSLLMEKLFNARWWDYSNKKFNISGRVCLINSLYFGIIGLFVLYYIDPYTEDFVNSFSNNKIHLMSLFSLVVFAIDFILSFNIMNKFKNKINFINRDNTSEIKEKINQIMNDNILTRRVKNAFQNYSPMKTLKKIKKKIANML